MVLSHIAGVNDAVCCRGHFLFLRLALLVFSACLEIFGYRVVPFHRKAEQAPISNCRKTFPVSQITKCLP